MNVAVSAAALALIIVSGPALGQDNSARRPAPVGHRQPTAADIEKAQAGKGAPGSTATTQRSSDIDQRLIICHGC
jgi:hypothetical protein